MRETDEETTYVAVLLQWSNAQPHFDCWLKNQLLAQTNARCQPSISVLLGNVLSIVAENTG